jgi:hypothetical protein
MGTVTVYTSAKMDAIVAGVIESATIDSFGHLILHKNDGSTTDAGAIRGSFDAASTSAPGIIQLATSSEVATGTDAAKAVTPSTLASTTGVTVAGKVDKSTLTTKGDLYVATGAAAIARLGAGTDQHYLRSNSGQTNGLQWRTVPGWWTRARTGVWYPLTPIGTVAGAANGAIGSNVENAIPMIFGFDAVITGIAVSKIDTTANFRLGIRNDFGDMSPGTVAYDSGPTGTGAGVIAKTGLNISVSPGVPIWFTVTAQGAIGTTIMQSVTHPFVGSPGTSTPVAADFTTAQPGMYTQGSVSGALPSTFTINGSGGTGSLSTIVMKVQFGSITRAA